MIKAILFDLDDTLLWDQKSVKEAFSATCLVAAEKYDIDSEVLENAVREEARVLYSSYETYPFTQMIGINPLKVYGETFLMMKKTFEKCRKLYRCTGKNLGKKVY